MMSRPEKASSCLWRYAFFLEFEGHAQQEHVAAALEDLKKYCVRVQQCGSFVNERLPEEE
jgi:prephenate dehydratase